jgi:hypothetical protein
MVRTLSVLGPLCVQFYSLTKTQFFADFERGGRP